MLRIARHVGPEEIIATITELAAGSSVASHRWRDRGRAPAGYIKGMAVAFGRVYSNLKAGEAASVEMAKRNAGDGARDGIAWYADLFAAAGLPDDSAGPSMLRKVFTLLLGLGMRESSGKHCEGRDRSTNNTTAETAEAGLFQTSYNARSASAVLLPPLITSYAATPGDGFLDVFQEGVRCSAASLENFGTGPGRDFQQLSKDCPAFAVEFAAVALRNQRKHWGPINRREAEILPEWAVVLQHIQDFIDRTRGAEAALRRADRRVAGVAAPAAAAAPPTRRRRREEFHGDDHAHPAPMHGAAAGGARAGVQNLDALGLVDYARAAAEILLRAHPEVVITSGRRNSQQQANAMAGNVVANRRWIEATYTDTAERRALQRWVDEHPSAVTAVAIAAGLLGVMTDWTDAQKSRLSRHFSGQAFDIQPVANGAAIKATIRSLPNLRRFLETEGGLTIWHADFEIK